MNMHASEHKPHLHIVTYTLRLIHTAQICGCPERMLAHTQQQKQAIMRIQWNGYRGYVSIFTHS